MTILEALEKWLATIAPGQDAKHNLEALNKASVALGGPGKFKSVGPAWDDVLSRYQGGGGGDYTPYDGEYEVTPSTEDQTLATKGKGLDENLVVKAISPQNPLNGLRARVAPSPKPAEEQYAISKERPYWEVMAIVNAAGYYDSGEESESHITGLSKSDFDRLVPENIKSGVELLGVEGSYEGETPESFGGPYEVTPSTVGQTLHTANLMMDEDVRVGAVNATIDENIQPGNIKSGVSILGVEGSYAPENTVKPIVLSRIGGVDNASYAAFFNGRHYLFGQDFAFYSTDGVSFQRDTGYDTAYRTESGGNHSSEDILGAFVFNGKLVVVVKFASGTGNVPLRVLFLYTENGETWSVGETISNENIAYGHTQDFYAGCSASHLVVYKRYDDDAKVLFYSSPDVSPLEFTFAQVTAGITAGTGSTQVNAGTLRMARWDNSGTLLMSYQAESGAWYFGKVSIDISNVVSEPVATKAFVPENITCMQYLEDEMVAIGLSTGSWIALTVLEEESQPGTVIPVFTGSSVLAIAFDGEGNGIAGGVGGNMAFCSAGGAWKTFTPINGGSNLASAAYGNGVFVMAGEGEEASISVQV